MQYNIIHSPVIYVALSVSLGVSVFFSRTHSGNAPASVSVHTCQFASTLMHFIHLIRSGLCSPLHVQVASCRGHFGR